MSQVSEPTYFVTYDIGFKRETYFDGSFGILKKVKYLQISKFSCKSKLHYFRKTDPQQSSDHEFMTDQPYQLFWHRDIFPNLSWNKVVLMLPMYPIHLTRNTNYIHLADFLPCCLETFLIDPRVSCEDKGQDVACARIRAGRLGRSAQCLKSK